MLETGKIDGWDIQDDLSHMTREFKFNSLHQALTFMNTVSMHATIHDHHPEWHSTNGGKNVNVRLTSHFANNTVTPMDFDLAAHMNSSFSLNTKFYKEYETFSWTTFNRGVVALGFGLFFWGFTHYFKSPYQVAPAQWPTESITKTTGKGKA